MYTVADVYALRDLTRNVAIPPVIVQAIVLVHKALSQAEPAATVHHHGKQMDWRKKGGNGGGGGGGFTNQKQFKKSFIGAADAGTPVAAHQESRGPPQKYVSKFKKTTENVEDAILNTILRGKLNKFSQSNYPEIKEFITHIIDGGQTEMIKCFMKLVFEKAASEEIFCPLYAKLISELSQAYPILLTEMANLYTQYLQIFEHVADGQAEDYDGLCQRNIEKKYRRGYSQFLAELIKNNVMDTDMFMRMVYKIIEQVEIQMVYKESIKLIEEYADCLMKIIRAISTSDHQSVKDMCGILQTETNLRIKPLTERNAEWVGISSKSRFTFLDIFEAIVEL